MKATGLTTALPTTGSDCLRIKAGAMTDRDKKCSTDFVVPECGCKKCFSASEPATVLKASMPYAESPTMVPLRVPAPRIMGDARAKLSEMPS